MREANMAAYNVVCHIHSVQAIIVCSRVVVRLPHERNSLIDSYLVPRSSIFLCYLLG